MGEQVNFREVAVNGKANTVKESYFQITIVYSPNDINTLKTITINHQMGFYNMRLIFCKSALDRYPNKYTKNMRKDYLRQKLKPREGF